MISQHAAVGLQSSSGNSTCCLWPSMSTSSNCDALTTNIIIIKL